jgi:nitrogen-specific signal transduction histidine kinase
MMVPTAGLLEVIARAFAPFFRTRPASQGTGLGLSMVYSFARQSSGQVRIQSWPGQDTIISIDLPRHLSDDAAVPASAELTAIPSARRGRDRSGH